ncbi:hypothetical protein CRG98_049187, partial [Punica granatum]
VKSYDSRFYDSRPILGRITIRTILLATPPPGLPENCHEKPQLSFSAPIKSPAA